MKIFTKKIEFETKTQTEFVDVTQMLRDIVAEAGIRNGQVTVFVCHSTMGVAVNHNEPLLLQDFARVLFKLVPVDDHYTHDLFELKKGNRSDGRSNGHSHCKSFLLGPSETVPVEGGNLVLGPRQSVFVVEFDGSRRRDAVVQVIGE
jgi:secondary thiamine-phosphate synthase enzyme